MEAVARPATDPMRRPSDGERPGRLAGRRCPSRVAELVADRVGAGERSADRASDRWERGPRSPPGPRERCPPMSPFAQHRPLDPRPDAGRARARDPHRGPASAAPRPAAMLRRISRTSASAPGMSRSSSIAATNRSWNARPPVDSGAVGEPARSCVTYAAPSPWPAAPVGDADRSIACASRPRAGAAPPRARSRAAPRARAAGFAAMPGRRCRRVQRSIGVLELAPVLRGERQVAERERVDALVDELGDALEIARPTWPSCGRPTAGTRRGPSAGRGSPRRSAADWAISSS